MAGLPKVGGSTPPPPFQTPLRANGGAVFEGVGGSRGVWAFLGVKAPLGGRFALEGTTPFCPHDPLGGCRAF